MVVRDDRLPSTAARRPPPTHPPYALMIGVAIRSLGEGRGSTELSISEYIRGNFEGLPWGHDRLLPYYLHKLTGDGEFVEGDGGRYRIVQDDGGGAAEEECPYSLRSQSESQLFEKRGVNGEDDVDALNRAVPAARETETGGKDSDHGIADIDDGDDDDEAAAVEPDTPMSGPLQGETKLTESVEAVANVDDDDDAAEESEPPPLQTEGRIENHNSEDGSKDDVDVADPLQRQTKQTVSVEAVADVDAAAATAEKPEPPPLPTEGPAENQSSEDVAEDLLQSHRVLPVFEGANVDEYDTQTLQGITHEDDAAEEPAPPLAKDCTEFVENHNFEDGSNNEERNIDNDVIEPLQSIVLTPSQPQTEGIENAEAIANVNNDEEGVPIVCEGDLVMKVQSLAIFLGPRNELESPNCKRGNSELVHELSRMSLMEPQEAESKAKNNGGEGSESKPKRRGRPPKKRRTHSSSKGSSTAIGDQDGDLERSQNSIVVSKPICPSGDVVVEPLQALVPHQEPINVDGAEKDLALVQSEPQKSVPKRRGRPPKRKLEAMDSSKKVMVLDGDVEPLQVVDPSSLGTNDNVVKLPAPEKTSGNKDYGSKPAPERRRRQSKREHESVDTSKEVIFHDGGVQPLLLLNPSPLGAGDNVKLLVYEEAAGNKGDGLQPMPKRRGRPPKRKHESTDRSKNVMPNVGDVEPPPKRRRKSKKSSNQDTGGDGPTAVPAEPMSTKVGLLEAMDTKECVELQKDQKESNPVPKRRGRPPKNKLIMGGSEDTLKVVANTKVGLLEAMDPKECVELQKDQKESNPVPKRFGRPPKNKLIMGGSEDTLKVVARRLEKIDKKSSTSVPKRWGRPPKPKPDMGDK